MAKCKVLMAEGSCFRCLCLVTFFGNEHLRLSGTSGGIGIASG